MSLVLNYKFDQADLTIDSSTSGIPLVNAGGVVSSVDATYGNVASFDGSSNSYFSSGTSLASMQGASSRTICMWINRNAKGTFGIMYAYGNPSAAGGGVRAAINGSGLLQTAYTTGTNLNAVNTLTVGTWYHVAEVYDGTTISTYFNGVFESSANITNNSTSDPISIGQDLVDVVSNSFIYSGYMSDFRVYDDALTATDLLNLTNEGPNAPTTSIDITMYTHVADLTWDAVSGASSYTVASIENSGSEVTHGTTTNLVYEIFHLTPGSSYEFRVYSDIDLVTPAYVETDTALVLNTSNIDALLIRLGNDLTLLKEASSDTIEPFLGSVLSTGEIVSTSIGQAVFVGNTGSVTVDEPKETFITSFDQSLGSGQSISVVLPDTSTSTIGYDETTNEVVSASTNYSVDSHFIVGGRKVTVKEV